MKRLICYTMALILLACGMMNLFSCTEAQQEAASESDSASHEAPDAPFEKTDAATDTPTLSTTSPTEPLPPPAEPSSLTLMENGTPLYSIVYPQTTSTTVQNAVFALWNALYTATGVYFPMLSDAEAASRNGRFLLIGNTALPESAEVKKTLSDAVPYAITSVGSQMVIVGATDEALRLAVNHYASRLSRDYDASSETLVFEGLEDDASTPVGFSLAELSRYSIVYAAAPNGLLDSAKLLQAEILKKHGVKLPIYADSNKIAESCEILIGQTNRSLSQSIYADASYLMRYEAIVGGASLQLACGGPFSARKCVERLSEAFLSNKTAILGEGVYSHCTADLSTTGYPISEGATARIMTLNMMTEALGIEKYPNVLPATERVEILAGMLIRYTPDVIGLQEFCSVLEAQTPYYLDLLKTRYGLSYEFTLATHNGLPNQCPVLYRPDRYTLDFARYDSYSYADETALKNGFYLRGASQVKLTSKENGSTFILLNSHWDHGSGTSTNPTKPERTQYCADAEAALVEQYRALYPDVRIFLTGDFNNHRPHIAIIFREFLAELGGIAADELARKSGTLLVSGGYQCSDNFRMSDDVPRQEISTHPNDFIDHVIGINGGFRVLHHNTILTNYCHVMTDHLPVYADIQFT